MARRGLCLNEVAATPALAQGTEKTHRPQDTQPRSRNSNSAPPEGTPEAIAYESHSSICLTSSSNYRFFNLREIQDSQCQRQPSHILLVIPISISQYNVSPCHTTRASFSNWEHEAEFYLITSLSPSLVKPCLRCHKLFWVMTPYLSLGGEYQSLWGTHCIHFQGWMGGSMYLRNIRTPMPQQRGVISQGTT